MLFSSSRSPHVSGFGRPPAPRTCLNGFDGRWPGWGRCLGSGRAQSLVPRRLGAVSHLCFAKYVVEDGEGPGDIGCKGDAVANVPWKACPVCVRLWDDCRAIADALTQSDGGKGPAAPAGVLGVGPSSSRRSLNQPFALALKRNQVVLIKTGPVREEEGNLWGWLCWR